MIGWVIVSAPWFSAPCGFQGNYLKVNTFVSFDSNGCPTEENIERLAQNGAA
jgi:hypothetical protein